MELENLINDLIRDEGLELKPYRCTSNKLTIGVGRNIEDNGITEAEARYLLHNDLGRVVHELDQNAAWWKNLPDSQKNALINMSFNLGWPRLSKFKNMLAALEAGDFEKAATEALDSRWASQVGDRAHRIAAQIRGSA